ncbi:MAG TPA: AAA family ATPase [Mycobacterium sp.]|nr:AAA family ATPase [Mycobacterium sp.]HTX94343.1 AAA family ATPase [Mycobacterium sp.]
MTDHQVNALAYHRILDTLGAAGKTVNTNGIGAMAQCPAHDDNRPSLSLRPINDSVLVHCFAGCQTEAVLRAVNLEMRDLYDDRNGAVYMYPDGRKVHRSPSKQFHQSGNTQGRALFHADRIGSADTVYVPEGEKDVLVAEALGAVAVCSAMGAGKAHLADWEPLRGKHAIVVADKDEPGRKHATEVAELLDGLAASVRIVEAAVGKDLADHIGACKTLDELVSVEWEVPPVVLTRLADVEPERVSWLWPGRIPLGKLVTLDGDPGLGKSTLALSIAAPVTTGGEWPDGALCEHPGGVLLLSAEDGLADTIRPRLDAAGADVSKVHAVQGVPIDDKGTLRSPTIADITALEAAIRNTDARLLVIDVLMAYLPTGTDSHKDQDIRSTLSRLAAMADRTNCAVLMIRHLTKASGRDPIYRGGGSIGIVGAARAGLLVASDPDDNDRRVLASVKSNLGPVPESLAYRLIDSPEHGCARVQWDGKTDHTAHTLLTEPTSEVEGENPAKEFIKDYLGSHGGEASAADVLKEGRTAGFNDQELKDARRRCRKPKIRSRKASFGNGWVWAIDPDQGGNPPEGGNQGGEGGGNQHMPPSPPSGDDLLPSANPLGAPTDSTPGKTLRVEQALAKARNAHPVPEFELPAGPDRCPRCGFHVPTQGHREDCRQATVIA